MTEQLAAALSRGNPSVRLRAVMSAGTVPDPDDLDLLVARAADEPDLSVRETITWALTRLPAATVVPRLVGLLEGGAEGQAASQALHTLSKIGDRSAWPIAVTRVHDLDDEVARTAWRCAVVLVPEDSTRTASTGPASAGTASTETPLTGLLSELLLELGRGDTTTQLALSRAIAALPRELVEAPLERAAGRGHSAVRAHAAETLRLVHDPDAGSEAAVARARREVALGRTRSAKG